MFPFTALRKEELMGWWEQKGSHDWSVLVTPISGVEDITL